MLTGTLIDNVCLSLLTGGRGGYATISRMTRWTGCLCVFGVCSVMSLSVKSTSMFAVDLVTTSKGA